MHKAESIGSGEIAVWDSRGSIREFRRGEILAPESLRFNGVLATN